MREITEVILDIATEYIVGQKEYKGFKEEDLIEEIDSLREKLDI